MRLAGLQPPGGSNVQANIDAVVSLSAHDPRHRTDRSIGLYPQEVVPAINQAGGSAAAIQSIEGFLAAARSGTPVIASGSRDAQQGAHTVVLADYAPRLGGYLVADPMCDEPLLWDRPTVERFLTMLTPENTPGYASYAALAVHGRTSLRLQLLPNDCAILGMSTSAQAVNRASPSPNTRSPQCSSRVAINASATVISSVFPDARAL